MGEVADLEQAQQTWPARPTNHPSLQGEGRQAAGAQKQAEKEQAKRTLEKLKKQAGQIARDGLTVLARGARGRDEALREHRGDARRERRSGGAGDGNASDKRASRRCRGISRTTCTTGALVGQERRGARSDWRDASARTSRGQRARAAMPSPDQMMSPEDRQKLADLRRRQKSLSEKTERLGEKAQKQKGELPGQAGDAMKQGLDDASEMMGRGEERFGQADPVGGRDQAERAAERLGKIGKEAQRAARPSQGRNMTSEPVKIPGSDQYKPPQEFREDILDAMKKDKAPRQYEDQVKRYYEELVK